MKSEERISPFIGVWRHQLPAEEKKQPEDSSSSTLYFMRLFPNGACTHHLLMSNNRIVFRSYFEGHWAVGQEGRLLMTCRELDLLARTDQSGEDTVICIKKFRGDEDLYFHRSTEEEIALLFQNLAESAGHFLEFPTQDIQEHPPVDWP